MSGGGGLAQPAPLNPFDDVDLGAVEDGTPMLSQTAKPGTPQAEAQAVRAAPSGWAALCGCLSVEYYRPLFNVTTAQVATRIKAALLPFASPPFFEVLGEVPDLYTPLWGSVTLVFLIGAMANFSSWAAFSSDEVGSIWHYDFALVTSAAGFIFGFLGLTSALTWVSLRYLGVPFSLTKLICLVGYSILPFLPAALLCGFPLSWLQWLCVAGAAALASLFTTRAVLPALTPLFAARYPEGEAGRLAGYVALALVVLQVGFGACMKFVFFSHIGSG